MKIVVLAGGISTERTVSLVSGTGVCQALRRKGHQAILVDMFMGLENPPADLNTLFDAPDGLCPDVKIEVQAPDLDAVRRSRPDQSPSRIGPHVLDICRLADIVFLGLHGQDGEDGRIQATLDLLGVPYTGAGYLGSAIAMDKIAAKEMMDANGIPNPKWQKLTYTEEEIPQLAETLPMPCVVKAPTGGSSLGVYLPKDRAELADALRQVRSFCHEVLVEQRIYGRELTDAVLGAKLNVLKTPENFNNDIGTPLTLLGLAPEHEAAVIETGMNHFGEIEYLGAMVRPDIAVISNIGDAHIEYLGSREGILKAKCEIFEHLKADGVAILNGDDALLDTVTLPQRIVRCGQSEHCETRISDIVDHGVDGITCTVTTARDTYALTIPAPGEHMAYSASMAVAVGEELGLSREEIVRGVAAYEPTGSRMRVIRLPGGRVLLDDCYNANPQSVTAALEILGRTDCERRVAVLGDMGELGDLTDQAHFNAGALAAMLGIDFVIAIGSKAARIADGAAMSGGDVVHFATKEEALPTVREQLRPNTSMLIKASHSMRFERLTEDLRKYYD